VRDPIFIRRVEDHDGNVLMQADARPRRVISEETAFLMTTMLADVVESGTAISARTVGFTLPAAGKTGTTNRFVDAWFIGFTPKLIAGVWVGFDQPRTIVKNGFAGQLAVPLWARFMMRATRGDPPLWFNPPADIVAVDVCRLSGQLPSEGCRHAASVSPAGELTYKSMVYRDYFVHGREPLATCLAHQAQYAPYPEPYFAVSAFDGFEPLFPAAPPDFVLGPVPTSRIDAVATSGIAPRRVETPPQPQPASPESVLPLPPPPETPPVQ
jgi:membrane peptidoglycan carboxypeptidase